MYRQTMKKNALRLVRMAIIAAISLEITWLAIGNLMLNTDIGPWLMSLRKDRFAMTWDSGRTLYPASFVVHNARIEIHTWSVDAEVEAKRIQGNLRFLPLLDKRAVIENFHARNATVVVQREKPQGERPPASKTRPGMIVEMPDAVVDSVDSLVFNRITVNEGRSRAGGSLQMQFRGDKVIEGLETEWLDAKMAIDDSSLPGTVNIRASGDMTAFNPRHEKGLQLAKKVSGRLQIDGEVATLAPLELLFPGMQWIERIDGNGEVAADIIMDRGKLQQDSVIDITARNLVLEFLGYIARGTGTVGGDVSLTSQGKNGEIRIVFDDFELSRRGTNSPLVRGQDLSLTTRVTDLDRFDHFSDLAVSLELPESEMPDVTVLNAYLPPALRVSIDSGSARMNGGIMVVGPEQEARARLEINGEKLGGQFRDTSYLVDFSFLSEADGEQLNDFRVGLGGTKFRLFNGKFDNGKVDVDRNWWMDVDVPAGVVDMNKPLSVEADVNLAMKDTRAVIALFADVREWVSRFDGFLTVQDVTGSARVLGSEQSLRVQDLAIAGDRLSLVAEVSAKDGRNDALVWGKLGIFSGGFERVNGETRWKLVNGRKWYERRKMENWEVAGEGR
jgi:hypothetical protein